MNSIQQQMNVLCSELGQDHLIVQGAGGNFSWKEGDVLWVKASGTWLSQALEKNIFVSVDLQEIQHKIAQNDFKITPATLDQAALKPSIETILHALMPQKFVAHLHPVDLVTLLIQADERWLKKLEQSALLNNYLLLDYAQPGIPLAKLLHDGLKNKKDAQLILLKNHGVVYAADTLDALKAGLAELLNSFQQPPVLSSAQEVSDAPQEILINDQVYLRHPGDDLRQLVTDEVLYELLEPNWAVCPDHIVFLGPQAVCFEKVAEIEFAVAEMPPLIFIKNAGIYLHPQWKLAQEMQLQFFYEVFRRLPKQPSISVLSNAEIGKLLNWDAETYRKNLMH